MEVSDGIKQAPDEEDQTRGERARGPIEKRREAGYQDSPQDAN
jgi:hypothetical protein